MNTPKEFKPVKFPFIALRLVKHLFSALILFSVYFTASLFIFLPSFIFSVLVVLLFLEIGFVSLQSFVIYRKRRYVFENDRILQYSGGIFSDSKTELLVKNITHVKRVYPFVEYGIFGTGHIRVEAAGSKESEVHINSIDNVEEVMQLIERIMGENGFNLGREELKYTENPHPLGAFFEVFKGFIVALAVSLAVISNFATEAPEITDFLLNNKILSAILFAVIIVPIFTWFVLRFLDLLKREYNIYSNIITYTEGFLDKHYAFIPFKNLSDSATTQTIIDRIFDLYDVKLSVQGSGHEILFKNLKRGREISETLDALIDEHKEETREAPTSSGVASKQEGVEARPEGVAGGKQKEKSVSFPDYETEFTDDFRINAGRHFFPLAFYIPLVLIGLVFPPVLLTLLFIIFVNFVPLFLQAKFTRFYIKKKGMLSHYKFLTAKDIEFSNEKITGLVIKRNFMDYWFNTATFRFYSIGAGSNLDFVNVDYSDDLAAKIQAKTGVAPKRKVFNIDSKFSFTESLRASFFFVLAVIIISLLWLFYAGNFLVSQGYGSWGAAMPLVLLGVIWGAIYIYQVFYYQRSKLFFYEDVVHFRKGIFFKDFFY
ncbi:MAG: PH domain-containing protein, partial [Patescibacteria group bacterium]